MASSGRSLIDQATEATAAAEGGIYTHDVAAAQSGAQTTGAFPRKGFSARSARDEITAEKMQMIAANAGGVAGQTPFGQVVASDADFKWLQKKRETEAYANLDAWIGKNFHTDDVTARKWLQEIWPDYYESREQLMIERAKFALRVKLLKLRGPKTEKDLVLQWVS